MMSAPRRDPLPTLAFGLATAMAAGTIASLAYVQAAFGAGAAQLAGAVFAVAAGAALLWGLARVPPAVALALAAALSLCLRSAAAWWLRDVQPVNDPEAYLMMSQALLDGEGLIARGARAYYPPLYPLLLAGARVLISDTLFAITLLNALIDGAAALLLWRLGRHLGAGRWAAVAGAAWLLWPPVLLGSAVAQKEGLAVALFVGLALALVRWVKGGRIGDAAVAGGAWGLLALTQPALMPMPMFLFGALAAARILRPSETVPAAAAALAVMALVLTPWWIRNFLVFGTFVPLTTTGAAFARLVPDAVFQLPADAGELEARGILMGQAAAWIAAHPLDYLVNVSARGSRALLLDIGPAQLLQQFRPPPPASTAALLALTGQLAFAALWSRAAITVWKQRWPDRGGRLLLALLLGTFAHLLAVNLWVQFYDRHRQPLTPLVMLVAAAGLGSRSDRDHGAGLDAKPRRASDAVE